MVNIAQKFPLCKGSTEYYVPLDEILFFETEEGVIHAHTRDDIYQTGYRLYELEDMLPGVFMRVSKSTIVNMRQFNVIECGSLSGNPQAGVRVAVLL